MLCIAPVWVQFEPIGYSFRQHVHHMVNGLDHMTSNGTSSSDDETSSDSDTEIDRDTVIDHSTLDPTQWKVRNTLLGCHGNKGGGVLLHCSCHQ